MSQLKTGEVVVGFDFDFTIGEFERTAALQETVSFVSDLPPFVGVDVRHELDSRVQRMIAGDHDLTLLVRRMFDRHVAQQRGARLQESTWSLFARLCLILTEREANPADFYGRLVSAEDLFWHGVSRDSKLFDGAGAILDWLHQKQVPVFVLTSSDARIRYHAADHRVWYTPEHSIQAKRRRLAASGLGSHLSVDDAVIPSDPFSKDTLTAWENLVFRRFSDRPDRSQWVFVGDARYDMQGALAAEVGVRIFIHRHGHAVPPEATHDVESIGELHKLLKDLLG